jgi:hypothetical protein
MEAVNQESFAISWLRPRRDRALLRGIALAILVSLALALAACQHAGPRAVTAATMRVFEPSLATFGDHAILGWHGGETEGSAIYLQRLDAELNTWSRPILLTDPTGEAFEPDLQPLENDLIVAWYSKDLEHGGRTVLLARVDWSGHVKWRRVLSRQDARNPVVRVAGTSVWVAWLENGTEDSAQVFAQHLSADGVPLEEPMHAGPASRETWNLNAAVDSEGTFYVIYDAVVGSGAKEVHLITANARGVRRTLLSGDDGVASVYPDIAMAGDRVAVSWVNARADNDQLMLFVGALDALSGTLDAAARPVTQLAGHDSGGYLAWSGAQLGLAWNRAARGEPQVLVQRFDRAGKALSRFPVALPRASTTGRAGVPTISAWRGGFAVAWNEYEQEPGANGRILRSAALVQAIN